VSAARIPVIDVLPLQGGDDVACRRVADELCEAARTVGFFYIQNHGIPQMQLDEMFLVARRFFAAPDTEKRTVAISPFHRGWLEIGATKMSGSDEPDLKESFVWGLDVPSDDPDFLAGGRLLAPNQWPAFMPEMRAQLMAYFHATQRCGQRLLTAFADGLGIKSDYFLTRCDKPVSRAALIYYPPRSPETQNPKYGAAPHTDYGTLTLLAQDDVGGLQVRGTSGVWVAAEPVDGTFVVNIGDLLARWSNGRFESTPHRVVNARGKERYSVAMFVDPNWNSIVEPVTFPGERAKHTPVGCVDYIMDRYNEAFAYRKKQEKAAGHTEGLSGAS
jgi:isopenicillin N synthase-like dioxygenase